MKLFNVDGDLLNKTEKMIKLLMTHPLFPSKEGSYRKSLFQFSENIFNFKHLRI